MWALYEINTYFRMKIACKFYDGFSKQGGTKHIWTEQTRQSTE